LTPSFVASTVGPADFAEYDEAAVADAGAGVFAGACAVASEAADVTANAKMAAAEMSLRFKSTLLLTSVL
jgi:hypothetical protein